MRNYDMWLDDGLEADDEAQAEQESIVNQAIEYLNIELQDVIDMISKRLETLHEESAEYDQLSWAHSLIENKMV